MAADLIKLEVNLTSNKDIDAKACTIESFIVVEVTVAHHVANIKKMKKTKSYTINSKFK